MKTIVQHKKAMIMKNKKSIFILLAVFAMAFSSCSRGYGCFYSSTEVKEIKPAVVSQQNDMLEVEEQAIISTELASVAE